MTFSGAVRITDLNDFIAPSQACVVALNSGAAKPREVPSSEIQLQPRSTIVGTVEKAQPSGFVLPAGPRLPGAPAPQSGDAVKVSLHDCLACSGCVTTAETMLLEQQSVQELLTAVGRPGTHVVVTVSPQSLAALAALYQQPPLDTWRQLVTWLRNLGARHVMDLGTARDITLLETAAEFVSRFQAAQSASSVASGDTTVLAPALPLPVLASACPGWVCYAEKTQGAAVLPHLSTTCSPQAVAGRLVKSHLAGLLGLEPASIFHATIMPCYDKKLEAARPEFALPGTKVPEVDCCLTTVELHSLLVERGAAPHPELPPPAADCADSSSSMDVDDGPLQGCGTPAPAAPLLLGGPGSAQATLWGRPGGSGGYMDFALRTAAAELFGVQLPPGPLPMRQLRNADFQVVEIQGPGGDVVLRGAKVYGFRNIQTLMRQIKAKRCEYHYVEVMACPAGCLNGGGQLKPAPGQTAAEVLQAVEAAYHHAQVTHRHPRENPAAVSVYHDWIGGLPGSGQAIALLHTSFTGRAVGLAGGGDVNSMVAAGSDAALRPRLVTDW